MDGKSEELVLVDTCVFLRYFFAEEGKDIVGVLLGKIVSKELKAVVSVCTLSELVTVCIHNKKEDLIPTIILFIRQNFYVANTTPETAILAGYFKAKLIVDLRFGIRRGKRGWDKDAGRVFKIKLKEFNLRWNFSESLHEFPRPLVHVQSLLRRESRKLLSCHLRYEK